MADLAANARRKAQGKTPGVISPLALEAGVDGLQSAAIAARAYLARVRGQRRVIGALVIRETRTRFADSKLG
jgi:hypothetical protein